MMTTRNSPLRINELSRITRTLFRQHHHGVGLFVLIATLFVLSFLAGLQPPMQFRVFMAGEVADSDIVAHRSLTVEDTEAAKIKRNQVAMLQPTVFDLSVTEIAALRQKIFGMLKLINGQETSPEAQDALRGHGGKARNAGQLGFARPVDEPRSAGVCPLHGLAVV